MKADLTIFSFKKFEENVVLRLCREGAISIKLFSLLRDAILKHWKQENFDNTLLQIPAKNKGSYSGPGLFKSQQGTKQEAKSECWFCIENSCLLGNILNANEIKKRKQKTIQQGENARSNALADLTMIFP